MATHSSVLAWRIPGMGEPGGLLSMGSHRVGHDWSDLEVSNLADLQLPEWYQPIYQIPGNLLWPGCTSQLCHSSKEGKIRLSSIFWQKWLRSRRILNKLRTRMVCEGATPPFLLFTGKKLPSREVNGYISLPWIFNDCCLYANMASQTKWAQMFFLHGAGLKISLWLAAMVTFCRAFAVSHLK